MSDPADPTTDATDARDRRSPMRMLVGWAISIACLAFILWKVDLRGAAAALAGFHWPFLAAGLVSLAFGYTMRIARWSVMLRATGSPVGTRECAAPFLGSIALNNVLPLRAGDVVRATIFPAAIGVPRSAAIGSIVMERLVDLLTLVLCLALGATALTATASLPDWLVDGAMILALAGTAALFCIFAFSGPIARLLARLRDGTGPGSPLGKVYAALVALLEGFRQMSAPRTLLAVFLLSALAWIGEAGLFLSLMQGFAFPAEPQTALLVMAFVTLSTLVPSSPGYVGPFHLAAFSIMVLLGSGEEAATSFAVLSHLMLWVPTTLPGGIAMLLRPDLFRGTPALRRRPT